jgi:hypothetical protein
VWWEALSAFPDGDAVRQRLHSQSLPYLQRLQALARRLGRPWRAGVDFGAVTAEGQFCRERSTGA